ncbi:uncharacterized protein BX664DRAFT_286176 [Halteromyces radiatus]|uniref:uncharacterized protein n=1 Tax=Halteromyces radiatus TaxID=101107 RepID=UPI0022200827|nr:uncharacterized protein BX664DRAFT_286176 [Halteromyces radiatus]KAI8079781.1 hypothetical protein BX664DRAFT_286176 [Halteromyces radiatus]
MTIDVYTFPPSLWAAVPRLIIEEKGIQQDVRYINVDLSKAENFSPEFLELNPQHTIPVLVDHDTKIKETDSTVVAKYLDDKTGGTLTPLDALQRQEMQDVITLLHGAHDVGNPLFFTAGSDRDSDAKREMVVPFLKKRIGGWQHYAAIDQAREAFYKQQITTTEQLMEAYDYQHHRQAADQMYKQHQQLWQLGLNLLDKLENKLKDGRLFLVGQTYTLADVHATPVLARLALIKGDAMVFGGRDYLTAYYQRIKAKPNFKTI